jgi:hypothetical protein
MPACRKPILAIQIPPEIGFRLPARTPALGTNIKSSFALSTETRVVLDRIFALLEVRRQRRRDGLVARA